MNVFNLRYKINDDKLFRSSQRDPNIIEIHAVFPLDPAMRDHGDLWCYVERMLRNHKRHVPMNDAFDVLLLSISNPQHITNDIIQAEL